MRDNERNSCTILTGAPDQLNAHRMCYPLQIGARVIGFDFQEAIADTQLIAVRNAGQESSGIDLIDEQAGIVAVVVQAADDGDAQGLIRLLERYDQLDVFDMPGMKTRESKRNRPPLNGQKCLNCLLVRHSYQIDPIDR